MLQLEIGRKHLRQAFVPFARGLGLSKFPDHADVFVLSFVSFTFAHLVLAPAVSQRFFPIAFGQAEKRAKNSWCAFSYFVRRGLANGFLRKVNTRSVAIACSDYNTIRISMSGSGELRPGSCVWVG